MLRQSQSVAGADARAALSEQKKIKSNTYYRKSHLLMNERAFIKQKITFIESWLKASSGKRLLNPLLSLNSIPFRGDKTMSDGPNERSVKHSVT